VQEAQNLTATGTAIGTPHYMSPEQFHNKAVTGASDQYSLGVVAYEMLAGKKPFDGGTYAKSSRNTCSSSRRICVRSIHWCPKTSCR